MSSPTNETQHQCSCGRTFRHGISLKRHQKVSGCVGGEEAVVAAEASAAVPEHAPVPLVSTPQETQDWADESGSVVVTAAQIARWQELKNPAPPRPPAAPASRRAAIDWQRYQTEARSFARFLGVQLREAAQIGGALFQVGARFTLFGAFVVGLGWVLLFGLSQNLSAAPVSSVDRSEALERAARSTVNSFLQTVQLNQVQKAHGFLSRHAQSTIPAGDLAAALSSFPLHVAPERVTTQLDNEGRQAQVTVERAGSTEVYTLVQEERGWSLASVAVRRR